MPVDIKDNFCIIPKIKLSDFAIIGEGGFGYVFKARHEDWGIVAVKSLKAEHVAERHKKNLQAEAEKLSRLNHQNIVQLYGVVLEAGNYSVVLEYVEHGNLDDFINTYKVPGNLKTKMTYSIVLGMNYLHTQTPPMIHRDLKSQNLLVTAGFECKITDFGLSQWKSYSRQHTSHNKSHTQGGTVTHIPPEVWEDCNYKADAKCDVYAMGILLWEIVTEKVPFEGLMDAQISLSVCRGQRPDFRLIPQGAASKLVKLIDLCWMQDPAKRPTFTDIKRDLDEQVTTEEFQQACEQASLRLMREITHERSKEASESYDSAVVNIETVTDDTESLQLEPGRPEPAITNSTLPYPVQRQTASIDSKKMQSGFGQEFISAPVTNAPNTWDSNLQTIVKTAGTHNRGYVQLNGSEMLRPASKKKVPQKSPAGRVLPSRNLQTDAAPADTRPQQESGKGGSAHQDFDGKEYLGLKDKAKHKTSGPHTSTSYCRPPPGAAGAFMPNFMAPGMQPSMIIRDGGRTVLVGDVKGGMNIQVGNGNRMDIINCHDGRGHFKQRVDHSQITKSKKPIDEENIRIIARNLGKPWMELGRLLGFSEGELEAVENDFRSHGHVETVYQMLLKWKHKVGRNNCGLNIVVEKLLKMDKADVAILLDK